MRVLVSGSGGYIGGRLVPFLAGRGHEVVGLDAGYLDGIGPFGPEHQGPSRTIACDTRDVSAETLRGFDAVVHLAELSNDPLGERFRDATMDINHRGSVSFARACRDAGVGRFVYSSSCSVYGAGGDNLRTEESPTDPRTAYALCKCLVERDAAALADDRFSPVFLRNATVFGPSPRMRFDLVLNNLCGLAWTEKRILLHGDGSPWRPLVHVADLCEAFARALEAPRAAVHNRVLNVGSDAMNLRVSEIAGTVARAFGGPPVVPGPAGGDVRSYRVSFAAVGRAVPGFRCRVSAAEGAAELRGLFGDAGLTAEAFASDDYTRLKRMARLADSGRLDALLRWRVP